MTPTRVLIVGNPGQVHVGRHLYCAAKSLGIDAELIDVSGAWGGPRVLQYFLWLWDHRPYHLRRFDEQLLKHCARFAPSAVIVTGISPPASEALRVLATQNVPTINYLTDDPFNPAHFSRWFIRSIREYRFVYTPRKSNATELTHAGCGNVVYLPFAFDPENHHLSGGNTGEACDVLFVGGCDVDRIPFVLKLIDAGLRVGLYGGYWDRDTRTSQSCYGFGDVATIRTATAAAKVNLILVRRANRDGHVMRSFEAAACGGCLLVEDTDEHREIFADTVTYFGTPDEMVLQAQSLLANPDRRCASSEASYRRIVLDGNNTYADRLRTILDTVRSR